MNDLPRVAKTATVFALVFIIVFLAVQAWERQQERARFSVQGQKVVLHRGADGHYHWPGRIGGQAVDFLVDTGASGSAVPLALAQQLALPEVGSITSQTAGGAVQGRVVLADLELEGGVKAERLRIVALPGLATPLLGMDVLGRLRWQQDAGVLKFDLSGSAR